ncbi:LysR family transcriptional regulator [Sinisalibacter lacisalsi]|uniref:LysR family transcriptional regulator n=1 Tax=Sinisalibacter lacisalsi TaxID=1526570 RepID=A0ABQ1QMC7_9RHOB|nr:LysR family transcriptional regulator [Sinisalibacter lacisalsi]GGD32183.1 LysR family transcriptional regulator [Sinisalibacter lacisalsi]
MDWDDIQFVLAVAREGSLSGAARVLGVNHATVLRRVTGFEQKLGLAIFERTARGYRLAPHRARVLAAMQAMEEAALGVGRALTVARAPLAGLVRVTSTDSICQAILPPIIARLQAEAEGLRIELSAQNQHADLARMDADIAVRPAEALPDELVGEVAGRLGFGVYAAPGGEAGWLGLSGPIARVRAARWMAETIPQANIAGWSDSFLVLREMAAAGQGRAVLPCVIGDGDPRLARLAGAMPEMNVDLWVASHADMVDVPRIRLVREMLLAALRQDSPRWLGQING